METVSKHRQSQYTSNVPFRRKEHAIVCKVMHQSTSSQTTSKASIATAIHYSRSNKQQPTGKIQHRNGHLMSATNPVTKRQISDSLIDS